MAFTSILRKSANSLAPLAIRLTQVQRNFHSSIFADLKHVSQFQQPAVNRFYRNTHPFSTAVSSKKPSPNKVERTLGKTHTEGMGRLQTKTMTELRNLPDHKRRLLAAKYEVRRKLYKALCKDPDLPSDVRDKHRNKLSKLPRNSSFSRVRNRCVFTGRPRGIYKFFRMSRIVFRGRANEGALMGIKKASW